MADPSLDHRAYMVRAKEQSKENFDLFFGEGVAAIGWSRVDVRQLTSKSGVSRALGSEYDFWGKTAPQVRGRKENEILRFNAIEKDDRILVPYYNSVVLAKATGEHRYDEGRGKKLDLANQIEVEYPSDDDGVIAVPRSELSEGLSRRLRVRGSTVSDLREFAEEIERLFADPNRTWRARLADEEEGRRADFRAALLRNIRGGDTNLETGGIGLEHLVEELLRYEGYDATRLSKQYFRGKADADIQATRSSPFGEDKLLVQVKHHQGSSGAAGLRQLLAIGVEGHEEYSDYKLVLITTGEADARVRDAAESHDIHVLDGEELMDWILEHVDSLTSEVRRTLAISEVPQLAV